MPTPLQLTSSVTDVFCAGNSTGSIDITVSGGVPPYSYLWSNGSTSEDLANITAGNYIINVIDAQGQSQLDTIVVNEPLPLSLSYVITNESSAGSSDGSIDLTVTGGTPPFSYFWNTNPSQTTEDITNLSVGNYIIYVGFNSWSCSTSETVTVSIDSSPVYGCTDPTSCNFDSLANIDDGSCYGYLGCIDPTASNYDPNACIDDGSCLYSCGPITGVYVDNIIHDRSLFNWDNMNISSCQVDQIRFRYREVGTNSYSTKTMGVPVGSGCNTSNTSKLVLGLTPSTTYEYDFKLWYCNAPTLNWHENGAFTTADACVNATNMTATPISTTKTEFCWDTPSSAWAFVRLQYRENVPGSSFSNIGGFGVMSPALCKTKNGLTSGTDYRVMWRTWCNPAGGPYRSPVWDGPVTWYQPTSIRITNSTSKERQLMKITDLLGREVNPERVIDKTILFYIYDNGNVERRIILE